MITVTTVYEVDSKTLATTGTPPLKLIFGPQKTVEKENRAIGGVFKF